MFLLFEAKLRTCSRVPLIASESEFIGVFSAVSKFYYNVTLLGWIGIYRCVERKKTSVKSLNLISEVYVWIVAEL